MKHNFIFKSLMSGFGMLVLLSACDDEIDPAVEHEKYVQEQKEAFAETFTEMFGEIPADQSWDFSGYGDGKLTKSTRGIITNSMSKQTVGDPSTGAEWLTIGYGDPLQQLFNNDLKEKNDNAKTLGEGNVYFVVPNTKFTIYPVMQGLAVNWDLYMQVGNMAPELIWKKSQNIQAWDDETNKYRPLGLSEGEINNAIPGLYSQLTNNIEWSSEISNPSSYYGYQYVYGSSGFNAWRYMKNNDGIWRYWYGNATKLDNGTYLADIDNDGNLDTGVEKVDVDLGWKTSCFSSADFHSVSGIQTKGYTFDLRQYAGQPVTFFLKINARSKYWKNVSLGSKMSSATNQMRFFKEGVFSGLNFSKLKSLGKKYMLIGIEDADYHLNSSNQLVEGPNNQLIYDNGNPITFSDYNKSKGYNGLWALSDYDYNDLVLLIISDEIETTTEEYYATKTVKKRYMVEDLGTTDDIDFNDMVVDLEDTKWYHYVVTKEDGVVKSFTENAVPDGDATHTNSQKATIRALGGTLDFDFKIGNNVVFKKSTSTYNSNSFTVGTMYNTEKNNINYDKVMWEGTVSGWNPSTNNVSFTVYKKGSTDPSKPVGTYDIVFPNLGEVPYIIAFDIKKEWRNERHPICLDWLSDKEDAQWEWPEPHNQNGDMTYEEWIKQNPKSN